MFVADIAAFTGSFIEHFQVAEVERRLKKDGQIYLSLLLKDRSGEIHAKLWEIPAGFSVTDGDFVKVEGETGTYRDEVEVNIRRIRKLAREEIELEDFLPVSRRNRNEMLNDLCAALGTIGDDHPALRDILLRLVNDLAPSLVNAPAAKSNHHAYLGGLLEHVLSLIGLAERVCGHYPDLDRDVRELSAGVRK